MTFLCIIFVFSLIGRGTLVYKRETFAALNDEIQPFYATQIINPFINSSISANYHKVEKLSANGKILIKGSVSLL